MANLIDANLHGGDQSEYLAQYFLSHLGASVLVPRQEDHGIDFHCALARRDGRRITFHAPFTVQLGSVDEEQSHKAFIYGGMTNPKTKPPEHRIWEVDFLRHQQLPFLVGTIDKKALRFRLYSASAMWFVLHRNENIGEIELCPDADHDPLTQSRVDDLTTSTGPLPRFKIPLGKPVIDVMISDIGTPKYESASEALRAVVEMEQKNLLYRALGVRVSWRPLTYEPNVPVAVWNYSFVPHAEITTVGLDQIRPFMITLAMVYKAAGANEQLSRVKGLLDLLPLSDIDKQLLKDHAGL